MNKLAIGLVVLAMALGACKDKGDGDADKASKGTGMGKGSAPGLNGGATAEAVVLRFVKAAAKRDLAAAKQCLMSKAQCKLVPPRGRASCPNYVERLHAELPAHLDRVPKGFVPDKVQPDKKMPTGKEVSFYEVLPKGGGKPIGVVVMPMGGRFYVVVPVKMKVRTK